MQIFLMRHGDAEARAASDELRPLTPRGERDVSAMVDRCRRQLAAVDCIWTSPYLRAKQTARQVADTLRKPVEDRSDLVPAANPDQLLSQLNRVTATLLLVSHQPLIGTLLERLVYLAPGRYPMGTASLACIEGEILAPACGELRWLRQPELEVQ